VPESERVVHVHCLNFTNIVVSNPGFSFLKIKRKNQRCFMKYQIFIFRISSRKTNFIRIPDMRKNALEEGKICYGNTGIDGVIKRNIYQNLKRV
jgi:hypothetical protein